MHLASGRWVAYLKCRWVQRIVDRKARHRIRNDPNPIEAAFLDACEDPAEGPSLKNLHQTHLVEHCAMLCDGTRDAQCSVRQSPNIFHC